MAKQWRLVALTGIVLALLAALGTLLLPRSYRADAQILIISQSRYGVDPYTVVKSAERVGENIAAIMKTPDFYGKTKEQADYRVDWQYFEMLQERKKRALWEKSVVGSVVFGTGVLNVSAYHPNASQAEQLAGAAAATLVRRGSEYVGSDVAMRVVSNPVATRFPVRPNIFFNAIIGGFIGVMLAAFVVVRRG